MEQHNFGGKDGQKRDRNVYFAKQIFARHYSETHGETLDPLRLTKAQIVKITLDYAENGAEYKTSVNKVVKAGLCPGLTGTQKSQRQGIARVFEYTFFRYTVELLQGDYKKRYDGLKNDDKHLFGFCKKAVPNLAERAKLFAQLRDEIDTPSTEIQIDEWENNAIPKTPGNTRKNTEAARDEWRPESLNGVFRFTDDGTPIEYWPFTSE